MIPTPTSFLIFLLLLPFSLSFTTSSSSRVTSRLTSPAISRLAFGRSFKPLKWTLKGKGPLQASLHGENSCYLPIDQMDCDSCSPLAIPLLGW